MSDRLPGATWPGGVRLLVHDEVTSTNEVAMALAAQGDAGELWVRAGRQSAGKGRSGRIWQSVAGNLFASHLFRVPAPLMVAPQIPLLAGVAVIDAVRDVSAGRDLAELQLKWPNDILVANAKLGGILVESMAEPGGRGFAAVVGIGLNVVGRPELAAGGATSLKEHGIAASAETMLTLIARRLQEWRGHWRLGQGFATVRQAWLERGMARGVALSVNAGETRLSGRFAGLAEDGSLLLDEGRGEPRRVTYGDVSLGMGADPAT
ncbi:MAG: biotin--[acetyl-CoA-carboxylase] ligase [Hyphomicrobiaceae bacterium]